MTVPFWVPFSMAGLLCVSAFFSASETAIFSLEPVDARRRTSGGGVFAESLAWCVEQGRSILVTILLSNLAANVGYFALAGWWAGASGGVAATLITLGALFGLVFFAEILPKSVAIGLAGPMASAAAPVLKVWALFLTPVRVPSSGLLRWLGQRVATDPALPRALTHGEVEAILRRDPERFGLGKRSAVALGELVGLAGIQVREIMVPIVDLRPAAAELEAGAAVEELLTRGWRWLLVRGADGTTGYVDAKDLLVADPATPVGRLARPLEVVPELARVPHLLARFRDAGVDRVLVVDEYGNDAGIVGRDDLTESIVGGLARSEHEPGEVPVRLRPNRGWEVDGSLGVHEFEDLFSVRMPIHRNRTIGGLIVEQLGNLPAGGERIDVAGLTFDVLGVSKGRVRKILVHFRDAAPPPGPEGEA